MADPAEMIKHIKDGSSYHLPFGFEIPIPQPFEAFGLHLTKFMVTEVLVALVMLAIFIPLARRLVSGGPPRGRFWNMLETIIVFVRDEVARPAIGSHDADRFLPFLWSQFFFILFLNLCGLLPEVGAPTGALAVTVAIAVLTFGVVVVSGIVQFGPLGFLMAQIPHMEVPKGMAFVLKAMIFVIEIWGMILKHFILAMRLFANMFAGHLVLAVVLGFIASTAQSLLWFGVAPMSVVGAVALNLLELLVACLQAYVFTFLSALFIGMAIHPH